MERCIEAYPTVVSSFALMNILIRTYRTEDREVLEQCIVDLMAYLSSIDPLGRIRQPKDFDATAYVAHLLEQVEQGDGVIFLAERNGGIVGCIAGCLVMRSSADELELYSLKRKDGKILELIVSPDVRGKGAGTLLMEKMEEYFREHGCEVVYVECFGPNTVAHSFYEGRGYGDRMQLLIKKL